MRELDVLLSRFLEHDFPALTAPQKQTFCELLELADPELASYLLAGLLPPDPELAALVRRIRGETCT